MSAEANSMPGAGWASPLALRATPSGTGSAQPAPGTPAPTAPEAARSHPPQAKALGWSSPPQLYVYSE